MNKCSKFTVLCVLLLAVRDTFSNDKDVNAFTPSGSDAEGSKGDLFRVIWQNTKERRSVKGVGDNDPNQTPKSKPQFECGNRILTLFLQQADVRHIRIHGPLGDQLQLGQLAAFCGVSVKTTNSDVRLIFSYDSCYVKKKTKHVLSVSWYGTDMTMSCPVSVAPPLVICKKSAMELTVVGEGTADELSVALNGEWAPLLYVATQCWHREQSNQGELTFVVPHTSCGVNFRDGKYTLNLRSKDKMMPLFCPHEPLPVSDSRFPVNVQPQHKPGVYQTPPAFPSATASEIIKTGQRFGQLERSSGKPPNTPVLQPRSPWLPKIPPLPKIPSLLPGSFNLAVNFPFSVPIPTRPPGHSRDHFTSEPKFTTSDPDLDPTPDPTPAPTPLMYQQDRDLAPGFQNWQHFSSNDQLQRDLTAPVTESPKPQLYSYVQLQKPASSLSYAEPSVQDYQHVRTLVPGTAQYAPFESSRNVNFPRPHQHHLSDTLSNLAQHLPPGYFICSYNGQQAQVLPQKYPVLQPAQPLQYRPYYYQNGYGYQGSTTTPLYPSSQFIPVNLQSQVKPYSPFSAYQPARPLQPQHYQKPNMQIQQSGSPTPPMKESRPLVLASSQTPQYVHYRPGGEQYFDPSRGVGRDTTETRTSSYPLYQQTQSQFPYLSLRPEVPTGNTGYTPHQGFFQPRSLPSASLHGSGDVPLESAPLTQKYPSSPQSFPVQGDAHVAQLPYSQGPSFRYAKNLHKPQNDTMPQSYRQASVVKGVVLSPHLRSASTEEVQQPRKESPSGSYFYRPPDADARK